MVLCGDETQIGEDMVLFAGVDGQCLMPIGNRLLFGPRQDVNDDFRHEQSLIIKEKEKTVLFAGCAHSGIVNIIRKGIRVAGRPFTHVFAGMHLVKTAFPRKGKPRLSTPWRKS